MENVKGTIKTMGKELSAAFDWAFDRLSAIQLMNEQFVYAPVRRFYRANAILWVKFQGFPITATERPEVAGIKVKTPADQSSFIQPLIMANGDQLYHIWSI